MANSIRSATAAPGIVVLSAPVPSRRRSSVLNADWVHVPDFTQVHTLPLHSREHVQYLPEVAQEYTVCPVELVNCVQSVQF